jgi:hypothetical protein
VAAQRFNKRVQKGVHDDFLSKTIQSTRHSSRVGKKVNEKTSLHWRVRFQMTW